MLYPEWIETVVIDHEDNVRILSPSWVVYTKQENCNKKIELTREQKNNLNQSTINDGYHPSFVILKVRYSHSSKQWKGLTVSNKSVTLRDDWI